MIKTVLIDDEKPALRALERLLAGYTDIDIIGGFINPLEALVIIEESKPNVVFLDINMPQLKGMDVAARILDISPDTDIVFVTAYDQYALEAFELYALDYLLKPIEKERFQKTVDRLMKKNNITQPSPHKKLEIKLLGKSQIGWKDQPPIKWRTEKTRELVTFLLHNRGKEVSKAQLIDALWTDCDMNKATHQLHNGIYYIRKTLTEYGIDRSQVNIGANYCLTLQNVELDIALLDKKHLDSKKNVSISDLEEAISLYRGEYCEGEDWLWADIERERYARAYWEMVIRLAELYIDVKEYDQAEDNLMRLFHHNPLDRRVTLMLLNLYQLTDNKTKGVIHYREYEKRLKKDLGIRPDKNLQKIFQDLKQ